MDSQITSEKIKRSYRLMTKRAHIKPLDFVNSPFPVQKVTADFSKQKSEKQLLSAQKRAANKLNKANNKNLDKQIKPKKLKKDPPGVACYTLKINDELLNPEPGVLKLIGSYIHYPICKINTIEEVL